MFLPPRRIATQPRELCSICTSPLYAGGVCPRCSLGDSVHLTARDREIIEHALGVYASDYNDAPVDEIETLRALLKQGEK